MPEDGFLVYDTELIKYWVFGAESLAAVSSDVKTALLNTIYICRLIRGVVRWRH